MKEIYIRGLKQNVTTRCTLSQMNVSSTSTNAWPTGLMKLSEGFPDEQSHVSKCESLKLGSRIKVVKCVISQEIYFGFNCRSL